MASEAPVSSTHAFVEHPRLSKHHHGMFFAAHLQDLPDDYASMQTNRVTMLHFAVTGLDILGELENHIPPASAQRQAIIEWVYSLQLSTGGFAGTPMLAERCPITSKEDAQETIDIMGQSLASADNTPVVTCGDSSDSQSDQTASSPSPGDISQLTTVITEILSLTKQTESSLPLHAHLPSTYSALCVLLALNDDLSRVHIWPLLQYIRVLQIVNKGTPRDAQLAGCISASATMDEADVRFVYCATAIPWLLAIKRPISVADVGMWSVRITETLNMANDDEALESECETNDHRTGDSPSDDSLLLKRLITRLHEASFENQPASCSTDADIETNSSRTDSSDHVCKEKSSDAYLNSLLGTKINNIASDRGYPLWSIPSSSFSPSNSSLSHSSLSPNPHLAVNSHPSLASPSTPRSASSSVAVPPSSHISTILTAHTYLLLSLSVSRARSFLNKCRSWDGGMGLTPGAEGHGGATYTAIASLFLMESIWTDLRKSQGNHASGNLLKVEKSRFRIGGLERPLELIHWAMNKQGTGYRGRVNKPCDCCYSFWVGATLSLLGMSSLLSLTSNKAFNIACEGYRGGFGKEPGAGAEILHSFYGVAGLSLMEHYAGRPWFAEVDDSTSQMRDDVSESCITDSTSSDPFEWKLRAVDVALGITCRASGIKAWTPMYDFEDYLSDGQ